MTTVNKTDQGRGSQKISLHGVHPTGRRRLTVNITPAERIGRVVIGLVVIAAGAVFLVGAGSVLAVVLEVLLVLAGADLAVTGALGHCPLYSKLGHVPPSLRRPS
ncbi:MAG: DUF2892 domain-containing protein [Acidimicrobiales bacterium]|nr:DUF2892 domain-containing protein [Acidimicrobiales bacterium]